MVLDITTIIQTAIANAISGLISNIAYIILFIWGIKFLGKEIGKGVKEIPHWLEKYSEIKRKELVQLRALGIRQ
jgi:hypothetical protein